MTTEIEGIMIKDQCEDTIINKHSIKQFFSFVLTSGVGWIIDFGGYFVLTTWILENVGVANFLSAVPAITYVFIVSTYKIFNNKNKKVGIYFKYAIYFSYQIVLLSVISRLNYEIYLYLDNSVYILKEMGLNLKILSKLAITPITLILNYLFMKHLLEKI